MNAIEPFDYSKMQEFDTSYLSGYLSEKYDVKMTDAYKNVLERIKDDSKEYLRKDIKGYSKLNKEELIDLLRVNDVKPELESSDTKEE